MRTHRSGAQMAALSMVPLLLLALGAESRAQDSPVDAAALVRKVVDARPKASFEADAVLSLTGGFTRDITLSHKLLGVDEATYIEVTAPLNLKNTRFLFLERTAGSDEQYMYAPALKRTIQVVAEGRKQPFLGSDFYVSDLVAPDVDAYDYAFASETDVEVGGRHCRLVAVTAKNMAGELYSKAVLAIDPADLLVMRSEFFDLKGALLKIWTIEKVEKIDGYWTPLLQKMTNVQQSSESVLEVKRIRYNVDIADKVFAKTYLQH